MLQTGKIAMWERGLASSQPPVDRRYVAAYPAPNQGAFLGRMGELMMSGQTTHPHQAWRWISYLSQHLPDREQPYLPDRDIPARRWLAQKASFWGELAQPS